MEEDDDWDTGGVEEFPQDTVNRYDPHKVIDSFLMQEQVETIETITSSFQDISLIEKPNESKIDILRISFHMINTIIREEPIFPQSSFVIQDLGDIVHDNDKQERLLNEQPSFAYSPEETKEDDERTLGQSTLMRNAGKPSTIFAPSLDDETLIDQKSYNQKSFSKLEHDENETPNLPTYHQEGISNPFNQTLLSSNASLSNESKQEQEDTLFDLPALPKTYLPNELPSFGSASSLLVRKSSNRTWSRKDFEIAGELGSGKFGTVFLAREKKSQYIVALKQLTIRQLEKNNMHHMLQREVEIQTNLHHSEYCPGGSLMKKLENKLHFSEQKTANYIQQLAIALEYCHTKNVIHRDIKPENILIGYLGKLKIADFGLSVVAPNSKRETVCGTPDYFAPEIVTQTPYNNLIDNWTIGVLTYELLAGKAPFSAAGGEELSRHEKQTKTFRKIAGVEFEFPSEFSDEVCDFIGKLLKKTPEERMSIAELLKHPWIIKNTSVQQPSSSHQE